MIAFFVLLAYVRLLKMKYTYVLLHCNKVHFGIKIQQPLIDGMTIIESDHVTDDMGAAFKEDKIHIVVALYMDVI